MKASSSCVQNASLQEGTIRFSVLLLMHHFQLVHAGVGGGKRYRPWRCALSQSPQYGGTIRAWLHLMTPS